PPPPRPPAWSTKPVLTSAQPRGDAAIVRGQARTAPQSAANRNDPAQPAAHLGGPRLASLVRVHQTFGGCWYPSRIRHNETTAFTKNPPPFRDRGSVLAGLWPAPVFRRQRCGILTWSSACCASLPSTGTEPRSSVATCLTAAVDPPVGATWPTR